MSDVVTLYEVGPRDGLQNEARAIPTADKIRLVDLLSDTGCRKIEVTSFVSPKWVPQMSDAAEVMAGIARRPGTTYAALTPNLRGLEAALAAGADEVAIFASASEGFSKANLNATIEESFARFAPVAKAATDAGVTLRGYVSCVVACPYDGPTAPAAVDKVVRRLRDLGAYEVSLGDTIGAGRPDSIAALLERLLTATPAKGLAAHYHDTGGHARANAATALDHGLRTFDGAVGGLGGCPYAPGAEGNVASETLVALFEERGLDHGLNLAALQEAADFARTLRGSR